MIWKNAKIRDLRQREKRAKETLEEAQSRRQTDAANHRSRASESLEKI